MASSSQVAMSGLGLKTQVAVGDGSVTVPSIAFSNDLNTGIYRGGADVLGVVTAGVERMRVDAAGNVGIGVTNPAYSLAVNGQIKLTDRIWGVASPTNNFWIGLGGTGTDASRVAVGISGDQTTGAVSGISFSTNNGNRMVVNSAGVQVQGYVKQSALPAFSVYRNAGTISGAQTVVWNVADTNITNSYNTTTGIFTVPVAGTYFFSIFGLSENNFIHLQLLKNGSVLNNCQPFENNGGAYQSCSGSTIATLAVGNQISVYLVSGSMYGIFNSHNGFCGYMIG